MHSVAVVPARGLSVVAIGAWAFVSLGIYFADLVTCAEAMDHLTIWTFLVQMLLFIAIFGFEIHHHWRPRMVGVHHAVPVVLGPSQTIVARALLGYILPAVLALQLTVAIGVNPVIIDTNMARKALRDHRTWAVWIYNFFIHYFTVLVTLAYLIFRRRVCALFHEGRWQQFALCAEASVLYIGIYMCHFDIRAVYSIEWDSLIIGVGLGVCSVGSSALIFALLTYSSTYYLPLPSAKTE